MHRQRWFPATDDQLREMAATEADRRMIARRFGRSEEAVAQRMSKLGLTRRT
jgi:hypothetical protein